MAIKKRKVKFYRCESSDEVPFRKILKKRRIQNGSFYKNGKEVEVKHVQKIDGGIFGVLVATKKSGIPPKHMVNSENYDPIPLQQGEGLAYANAFYYHPEFEVIAIEYNKFGGFPDHLQGLIHEIVSGTDGLPGFNVSFHQLLNLDTYNLIFDGNRIVKKAVLKFANPTVIANEITGLGPITTMASESNSSKSLEMVFESSLETSGLSRSWLRRTIDGAFRLRGTGLLSKCTVEVSGTEEGREVSVPIKLFDHELVRHFSIDEPPIQVDVQVVQRKAGILEAYTNAKDEIQHIISIQL